MAHKALTDEDCLEAVELVRQHGNPTAAARASGHPIETFRHRHNTAIQRGFASDPAIREAARVAGVADVSTIPLIWKKGVKDGDGNTYSVMIKNPVAGGEDISFIDMIKNAAADRPKPPKYPKRPKKVKAGHLAIIDLADVHFGKLCMKSATGHEYNPEIARHRVIEGTKALLAKCLAVAPVERILFVLGNDSLHVDSVHNATTKGTRQDVAGSIFEAFRQAKYAFVEAIEMCAKEAEVDLLHCMSNHDSFAGFALTQAIAAELSNHPHVHADEYYISEIPRKYYGFNASALGFKHGHVGKDDNLTNLMLKEAKSLLSNCDHFNWYIHDKHHHMRKQKDADGTHWKGKDHIAFTQHGLGSKRKESETVEIQYVRSPSPPDSWHSDNEFVNKQAVECFIHHPVDGQIAIFTEWF